METELEGDRMDDISSWEDTKNILRDLEELYLQNQDILRVKECIEMRKTILDSYSQASDSIEDLIRNFTSEVDLLKETAAELAGKPSTNDSIEALKKKIEIVQQQATSNQEERLKLEEEVQSLEKRMESLSIEKNTIEKNTAASAPVMQHLLGLYANVTKIKWDFDSENVAGVVTDAANRGLVRKFDLSPKDSNSFEIANSIWDVISNA
mmetsp:Transcript_13182/g.15995  ORF Transcript_13182/g.15995 Transcript_13182/m.15995 type:complete len:209 (+) Transcript_13182:31-657(+)